jgi:carboxyl-terminal processing protease
MKVARVTCPRVIVSALALVLAGCGGGGGTDGGGGSPPPTSVAPAPSPTPTPSPTPAACSLSAQQDAVSRLLDEWYLFPDLLATVNPASFTDLQSFIDARVAPARAQGRDRFFTGATSIAEETALIQSGASAGFGIRLGFDSNARRLFVVEGYEGTPGFAAGLDRGTEILAIGTAPGNLQTVTSLFASGGSQAVSNALGPNDAGVTRLLQFRPRGGAVTERSVTKAVFSLDPVSDRYGTVILNDAGQRVGYLNLRTFIVEDAQRQMREAFGRFRSEGVSRVIVDLRYNGGGLVSGADVLGDLLLQGRAGQVWSRNVWRPEKEAQNRTRNIASEANAINPARIAFITTGASASASELVINSLLPYVGNNIALIGTNTFGKPVGQAAFDFTQCDLRVRPVTFRTVNAAGQGEYFNGLASVMPNTCRANDDITVALGDPAEASIRTALDFLAGRVCTPIVNSTGTMWQMREDREMLMPREPSASQTELPGLF